ncbi:MAG: flagellar protein FliS [Porticoccaceae bacterium]|jgi:flagellar protein FliS
MTLLSYQSVRRATLVEGATPHRLVEILYEGALSNIAIARKHVAKNDRRLLHKHIDKSVAVIQELQASLQDYQTNELSASLFDLYSYIVTTLIESNKNLDDEGLVICQNLIEILNDAWSEISPEKFAA